MIRRKEDAKTQDIASVVLLTKCKRALKFWCKSVENKLKTKKIVVNILHSDRRLCGYKPRSRRHLLYSVEIRAALDFLLQVRNVQAKLLKWKEWTLIAKSAKELASGNAKKAKILAYIKLYFAAWKAAAVNDGLKRTAFATRLNIISIMDTLRYGFSGFVQNDKAGKIAKKMLQFTKRRSCNFWLVKFQNRRRMKKTVLYMCSIFVYNELKKAWNHWKVIDGPARRFEDDYLHVTVFNRWYNCALTRRHHRRVTLHKVLHRWHDHILSKGKAKRDVRRGRHLLLILITKLRRQNVCLLSVAFCRWKEMHPVTSLQHANVSSIMPKNMFGDGGAFPPAKSGMRQKIEIDPPSRSQVIMTWRGELNELRASRSSNNASRFRAMSAQFSGLSKSTFNASMKKPNLGNESKRKTAETTSLYSTASGTNRRVLTALTASGEGNSKMQYSARSSNQVTDNVGSSFRDITDRETDEVYGDNSGDDNEVGEDKLSIHELM